MKKINFIGRYAAFFLSVTLFTGVVTSCKEKDSDIVKPKTITDVILENAEFSTLREIILDNDLSDALRTENLTIFAPNNAAFVKSGITSAKINALPTDSARAFVFRHIIKENITYEQITAKKYSNLVAGDSIVVTVKGTDKTVVLNGIANVITKNVNADNGKIQVVNSTLVTVK